MLSDKIKKMAEEIGKDRDYFGNMDFDKQMRDAIIDVAYDFDVDIKNIEVNSQGRYDIQLKPMDENKEPDFLIKEIEEAMRSAAKKLSSRFGFDQGDVIGDVYW